MCQYNTIRRLESNDDQSDYQKLRLMGSHLFRIINRLNFSSISKYADEG